MILELKLFFPVTVGLLPAEMPLQLKKEKVAHLTTTFIGFIKQNPFTKNWTKDELKQKAAPFIKSALKVYHAQGDDFHERRIKQLFKDHLQSARMRVKKHARGDQIEQALDNCCPTLSQASVSFLEHIMKSPSIYPHLQASQRLWMTGKALMFFDLKAGDFLEATGGTQTYTLLKDKHFSALGVDGFDQYSKAISTDFRNAIVKSHFQDALSILEMTLQKDFDSEIDKNILDQIHHHPLLGLRVAEVFKLAVDASDRLRAATKINDFVNKQATKFVKSPLDNHASKKDRDSYEKELNAMMNQQS